jgi:hypothetical protein
LEVTGGIQPFRALGHFAVLRSVPMSGTTLTEVCIAGLLVAVKELLFGVPAIAARVAAFPSAQFFAGTTGAGLLALAAI